jgi:predicted Zn-dependent protease
LEQVTRKEGTYEAAKHLLPKFNRDQERESDYLGLIYAYQAGYNPDAGVDIWEGFSVEVAGTLTTDFFSSYPWSPERMLKTTKVAQALTEGKLKPELVLNTER